MDFLCGQMKCGGILLDSYLIYWGKSISKNAIILSKSSGIDRCPMAYKSFLIFPIPFSYQKKRKRWHILTVENAKAREWKVTQPRISNHFKHYIVLYNFGMG